MREISFAARGIAVAAAAVARMSGRSAAAAMVPVASASCKMRSANVCLDRAARTLLICARTGDVLEARWAGGFLLHNCCGVCTR